MKSWVLNGDVLEVADGATRIPAQADHVYASVLEKMPAWPDLPAGKCGEAVGLQFSRYPVEMAVVIAVDGDTGRPILTFEARSHKGESFPVSRGAVARGHVVHERTWYPGAPENTEAVMILLEKAGYNPETGNPRKLAGFLILKRAASEGGPVIDKLPDDALTRLVFKAQDDRGPEGITAQLYPYQRDGWRWLRFIMREELGGLLADEMGLGKTLQVICALRDPGGDPCEGGALVLAPGSLLENWIREIARFCPDFRTLKHHGGTRSGSPAELQGFDVVVSSYDTAIRDLSLLKMVEWGVVVLDEAQNIRNPAALRTKSVKQISRAVGLAVTGTPMENRLRDLWSIMDFVVPGYLGDLKSFEARYNEDTGAAAMLEPLVSPLMLRRHVSEVARDLPERIDIPEVLELSEAEACAYDEMREKIFEEYGATATLVSLGKLRQFCAHPDIVRDGRKSLNGAFSKFDRLKELLEEIFFCGEKALVFTSYTKMADLIAEMTARELGSLSATLDGRRDIEDRQPLIDGFSAHAGPAVLVLNPRAGGSGLNITAANHVIHYNPEWNPALEDQASARAHRRGQERPVTVRRLIYAQTVEEVIDERLRRKRDIAQSAIIGVEGKEEDYADILAALERSPSAARTDRG